MNILLTSAGRRTYLVKFFKQALNGKGKVFVSNSDSQSPAVQIADESITTPLIYDQDYIPFLIEFCKVNDIKAIIPLFDVDVFVLAKNKEHFLKADIQVIVGDWQNIAFCNDKLATFNKLNDHNILVPKTINQLAQAKALITKGELKFPLIVKPRWGMGSIGMYEAVNESELEVFYSKCLRDIKNGYLIYESNDDIENSVIIQEKIKAVEFGLDVINDLNGMYQTTIVKKKNAMRSGETDSATVINAPELKKLGEKLSTIVQHPGNLDVDVLFNGKDYYVLELNARFGGGYPFTHLSGVNLPLAIVKWLQGDSVIDELRENHGVSGYKDLVVRTLSIEEGSI